MDGPVKDKGKNIGNKKNVWFEKCAEICLNDESCNSFTHGQTTKECYFKDKKLNGSESIVKKNPYFYSAYKICSKGEQN